jgi:hypothetical protein
MELANTWLNLLELFMTATVAKSYLIDISTRGFTELSTYCTCVENTRITADAAQRDRRHDSSTFVHRANLLANDFDEALQSWLQKNQKIAANMSEEIYKKKFEAPLKHVRGEMEKVILAKSMKSITAHAKPTAKQQAQPNGRF